MQTLMANLNTALEGARERGALEVAEVPAFVKGFCAQAACGAEASAAALRWATGYVQRETRKVIQYQRWAKVA